MIDADCAGARWAAADRGGRAPCSAAFPLWRAAFRPFTRAAFAPPLQRKLLFLYRWHDPAGQASAGVSFYCNLVRLYTYYTT